MVFEGKGRKLQRDALFYAEELVARGGFDAVFFYFQVKRFGSDPKQLGRL